MQIGLFGIVFVMLLLLKILEIISISWWWVFSPLIVGVGFGLLCLIFVLVIAIFRD